MNQEHSEHQIEQAKRHEGLRRKVERDSDGSSVIGWGFNEGNGLMDTFWWAVWEEIGISEDAANILLGRSLDQARKAFLNLFGSPLTEDMKENHPYRYTALINMLFNLGETTFRDFTNTIRAIQHQDWKAVAYHMLDSKWRKQVKNRAYELAYQVWKNELIPKDKIFYIQTLDQKYWDHHAVMCDHLDKYEGDWLFLPPCCDDDIPDSGVLEITI